MYLGSLGTAGATTLCRNSILHVATCSSSLRYKTNIGSFNQGLDLGEQTPPDNLRLEGWPACTISASGAEDVEKAEPLLVTYNDKGEVEGVK